MSVNATSSATSTAYSGLTTPSVEQSMSIDSFLNLLAAQLQNQDMLNPMSDTEFISQMAQFTALELQQATAQITSTQFAVSLIGLEALAVNIDPETGQMEQTKGTIEGVSLYEGTPMVVIDGKSFTVGQVMTLGDVDVPINITESSAERIDDTSAKFSFTSSIEGEYYVEVVEKDGTMPSFDLDEEGILFTNTNVVGNVTVTEGPHDIYIVVRGKDGTISAPHKITVDAVDGYVEPEIDTDLETDIETDVETDVDSNDETNVDTSVDTDVSTDVGTDTNVDTSVEGDTSTEENSNTSTEENVEGTTENSTEDLTEGLETP